MITVLLGIFIILTSVTSVSAASTVYINATGGSDSNNGSIDSPYQTIGKGIKSADENGTVQIADGIYSGEGNTNITINRSMTITGQSQNKTIINGSGTNWIFNIGSGVTVTILNLTMTNATITGNGGGAISNRGNLTVTNCTFTSNTASIGGAIYNKGNITALSGCTFNSNTATNGGAIFNYNGTINNLSGCTFTDNVANTIGGAIFNYNGTINVNGCTFTGNTADEAAGAICSNGNLTVTNCTFIGNNARWGGAIYNVDSAIITLNDCKFTGNTATYGGAITNYLSTLNMSDCTLTGNNAQWGGAILNYGSTSTGLNGCTFTGNTATYGSAIYNYYSTIILNNCTFKDNTATTSGGAIYNGLGSTLNMSNCTFTGNNTPDGGAIYNKGTITGLSGCTFTGNNATYGGAINNFEGTITGLSGCTFTGNTASYGGAVFNHGTISSVSGCTFSRNVASSNGGAICNIFTINSLTGCTFTGNNASLGGAIRNVGNITNIHFCRIVGNNATYGSAINNLDGSVNAEYNWWGSNTNPKNINNLITGDVGNVNADPWLVISISANPTEILNTKTSNVTVDLYNDSNGVDHSNESDKYPSEIPLTFTTTWGSIAQTILNYGTGSAIFTANGGSVPQQNPVTVSVADSLNQAATLSTNITIKPTVNLYIHTTTNSKNLKTGERFLLTYKLGNKGPDTANNVTIIFQLPEGLNFINIRADNGNCTYNPLTRTVTWTLDSVPVGDPYLYLTVQAAGDGTYKITPNINSTTYNLNTVDSGIITINVQSNNNNNSNNESTVNTATKTTIGLQETGLPLNYIILALFMVISGLITSKKF